MKKLLACVAVILVLAGLLLVANLGLAQLRAENLQKEHVSMMQTLLPGSKRFVLEPYSGEDTNVRRVHKAENGYVVETVTEGYAGPIAVMVGVSNEGKVTGLVVRYLQETPGLGAEAMTDTEFMAQFLNTAGEAAVGENVDSLTGATVTSKAVTRCVNSAVAVVTGADTSSGATS